MGTGLADAAHEDVHDGVALRSLCGVDGLVGCHAQGNAGIRAALHVQLDGFFDLVGVKPAHLGGLLERPLSHVLLHDLECRASLLAVGQRVGAEHLGVDGAVCGKRVRHGHGRVRVLVPHDVLVVGAKAQLACTISQARILVHQEGQVRPLAAEVLRPQVVLDDVVDPAQHQRHVGAGADGQPHIGARGVRRQTRVDDDGLHTVVAQLGDNAACRTDAVIGRADAPHDVRLRRRALVVGQVAGQVHLGDRAVGQAGVGRAVQAELHVVARQVALRAAGLEEVAAAPHGQETRRAEELRISAAARGRDQALRAFLLVPLPHNGRNLVHGLAPGDTLPFVGTALTLALHGVLDAVGVVQRLDAGKALRARGAFVHGVLRVAFQLHDLAVAHVRNDAAVVQAGAADRADLLLLACGSGGCRLNLHEVVRRSACHGGGSARERGQLHEAAAADVRLCQNAPILSSFTRLLVLALSGPFAAESPDRGCAGFFCPCACCAVNESGSRCTERRARAL